MFHVHKNYENKKALIDITLEIAKNEFLFISGPSGAGKELLAKAIAKGSGRRDEAFVAFNCAAIPDSLLESELFGYCKGAFTGALKDHPGLFQ